MCGAHAKITARLCVLYWDRDTASGSYNPCSGICRRESPSRRFRGHDTPSVHPVIAAKTAFDIIRRSARTSSHELGVMSSAFMTMACRGSCC